MLKIYGPIAENREFLARTVYFAKTVIFQGPYILLYKLYSIIDFFIKNIVFSILPIVLE